jgi:hypothetical protein
MNKWKSFKVFVTFVLVLGLFGFLFPLQKTEAVTSKSAHVTTHYYKGEKFLKYPQVSGQTSKSAQNKINTVFLGAVKKSYQKYLQTMKQEKIDKANGYCQGATCNYIQSSSYQTKYNTNGKLSILYHDYQYAGGAHGGDIVTSYNFSLSTGKQYKINDILKTTTNFKKVTNYAFNYLSSHEPYKEYIITSKSEFSVNKNTQFYFTSGGIYLVFQEYEVCAYAAGQPILKIPSSIYK